MHIELQSFVKLNISNNDSLENINNSVKKFNVKITVANNNTTHIEKKLTDMMSDSNNNIKRLDDSIEKFNTSNNNDLAEIKKSIQDMMSDTNNNIKRLDDSSEKCNTNNSNDLAEIKKSIQDLKEVMDNTRKELTDMKQTLDQLMSTIETVEKENILLRSQAQLTKISGTKQTFQENAGHTRETKSDTRKAKPQVLLLGTSNVTVTAQ